MAYTEVDLTAVRAEMAQPESVRYGDRDVRRRPMADLMALEARILADIAATTAPPTRSKQTLGVASRGF